MDELDLTVINPDCIDLSFDDSDGTVGSIDSLIEKMSMLDSILHLWEMIWELVSQKADAFDRRRVSLRVRVIHHQVVSYTQAQVCRMAELHHECKAYLYDNYGLVLTTRLGGEP